MLEMASRDFKVSREFKMQKFPLVQIVVAPTKHINNKHLAFSFTEEVNTKEKDLERHYLLFR